MGFKIYLTGHYSVDELTDILYQKGLRSRYGGRVPHSVMTFVLKNPFYAGIMKWNGQVKKGKHPAMITQNEHQRILQIMDAHNLHVCRRRKHSFLLRGFIFCNICGQRYTAEKHSKKNIEYYHCSATRKKHSNLGQNVKVMDLEKQVEEYFKNIQFSQEFIEKVVTQVKNLYHYQKEKINQRKQAFYNRKMALEKRRDIVEEKLFEGLISDDDFVRVRDKIRTDLEQIQDEVDKLEDQREYDIQVFEKVLKLTRNIYKAYTEATDLLKRCFIGLFWEKFLVQDKKIVSAIPTKLICALQEKDKVIIEGNWLRGLDSNQDSHLQGVMSYH